MAHPVLKVSPDCDLLLGSVAITVTWIVSTPLAALFFSVLNSTTDVADFFLRKQAATP